MPAFFRVYALVVAAYTSGVADGQAKPGETLPQLVRRFGNKYTVEGTETTGQVFKFRSSTTCVDVLMYKKADVLRSEFETYYFNKPMEVNGNPPEGILRGLLTMMAPDVRWKRLTPVGAQKEAFITPDETIEVAVLPPDETCLLDATFSVVVASLHKTSNDSATEVPSSNAAAVAVEPMFPGGRTSTEKPSVSTGTQTNVPPNFVRIDSSFIANLAGKNRKAIQAMLGCPAYIRFDGYIYAAKIPGIFAEMDGSLIIFFAGDKARAFSLDTPAPPDTTFVLLTLQNAPKARFAPIYRPENLTGRDWRDGQNGFLAWTGQSTENAYIFGVDLTPDDARRTSPFYKPKNAR